LKGVLGGGPYPVLWIDLDPENEVHQAEDEVLGTSKPSAAQIRLLTGSFISANDNYLCSPYFFRDGEKIEGYEEIDEAHLDELLARHDRFEQTKIKRANEADTSQDAPANDVEFDINVDVPSLTAAASATASASADLPKDEGSGFSAGSNALGVPFPPVSNSSPDNVS
jgi:hypothetical protein